MNLTKEQETIVNKKEGNYLVLASCGSGKTSVVQQRVSKLITTHKVDPENILCISFTKRSVQEMEERIVNKTPKAIKSKFTTFHALAYKVFLDYGKLFGYKTFKIVSSTFVKNIVIDKMVNLTDEQVGNDIVSDFMVRYKEVKVLDRTPLEAFPNKDLRDIYYEVEETMQDNQEISFDDLLYNAVKFLQKNEDKLEEFRKDYKYILVDEMQDTNLMQFKLLGLINHTNNVMAVGDQNQCIFAFAGARVENILDFERMYNAEILPLSVNFRSTPEIVHTFNKLIDYNIYPERFKFRAIPFKESIGVKPKFILFENRDNQAMAIRQTIESAIDKGYDYKDITILYRNNAMSIPFEKQLIMGKIPYKVKGGSFLERKEIKMILACFKYISPEHKKDLSANAYSIVSNQRNNIGRTTLIATFSVAKKTGYKDFQSLVRSNKKLEGIGEKKLTGLKSIADTLDKVSACFIGSDENPSNVKIDELISIIIDLINYGKPDKIALEDRIEFLEFFGTIWTEYLSDSSDGKKSIFDFLNKVMLNQSSYDREKNKDEDKNSVQLSTIHSYKGAENKIVFLTNVQDSEFPRQVEIEDDYEYQNEMNLFYVGLSRAKDRMFVTSVGYNNPLGFVSNLSLVQGFQHTDLLNGIENIKFIDIKENVLLRNLPMIDKQ